MNLQTLVYTVSRLVKTKGELKFALFQVTTRCNAKCTDRCNIWASKPVDMKLDDARYAIDVLAKNGFSVIYFTGGETSLYPHLVEVVEYAKKKGMITSLTTNGTISKLDLEKLRQHLDILSISVDHYNEGLWDAAKHVSGISKQAREVIIAAKAYGIKLYAITFLNPSWTVENVEQVIQYVNDELELSFALSYPFISSNKSTFNVGGELSEAECQTQQKLCKMVMKILQMKMDGADVITASCYLRDVVRAHNGFPMKYPCNAGKSIISIDCNLNVYPCYKREKICNLKDQSRIWNLNLTDIPLCDTKFCLINCFKEASLASRKTFLQVAKEELVSNPKFYLRLLRKQTGEHGGIHHIRKIS
ncbi:MAG: radical SAM protein [Candidatus Bathyarchaeota archaeon]|nr:radical SAM protein [Candidatus Bathyarchaeota archaeon]